MPAPQAKRQFRVVADMTLPYLRAFFFSFKNQKLKIVINILGVKSEKFKKSKF